MRKCLFISRNYKHPHCGGGIARTDIETVMERLGFENIGLRRTFSHNGIVHGVRNTIGVFRAISRLRRGDVVVVQYQMKRYTWFCRMARRRGVKVICLIHDLDSFREKKLRPEQEIPLLNMADVILTHNAAMRRWLTDHGCTAPMVGYTIMDFLYQLAEVMPGRDIYLYGSELNREKAGALPNLHYMGEVADTEIIARHSGDFGLSWYGLSLDEGIGKVGEYMAYNNPHKVGLYLRCNAPVVVWKRAGRAEFIEREQIGIAVDSLRDLDKALDAVDSTRYAEMTANVARINARLKAGHYLETALSQALRLI